MHVKDGRSSTQLVTLTLLTRTFLSPKHACVPSVNQEHSHGKTDSSERAMVGLSEGSHSYNAHWDAICWLVRFLLRMLFTTCPELKVV